MDLNFLLARHQISLMRADAATSFTARHVQHDRAKVYAHRIRQLRERLGAGSPLSLVS